MTKLLTTVSALALGGGTLLAGLPNVDAIVLQGTYQWHLQDVWFDGTSLYWDQTTDIVRTDLTGKVLARTTIDANHHGGLTVHDGRIYAAVCPMSTLGAISDKVGCAKVVVGEYDAQTLQLITNHVTTVNDRAGSLARLDDGTFLVGCLRQQDMRADEVRYHHFDAQFNLIKTIRVPNVPVMMGIEVIRQRGPFTYLCLYGVDAAGKPLSFNTVKVDAGGREVWRGKLGGEYGLVFDGDDVWTAEAVDKPGACTSRLVRRRIKLPRVTRTSARVTREGVAKEWRLLARDIAFAGKDCLIARDRVVPYTPDESECVDRQALIWKTDRDPLDVALRRTRALADDLKGKSGFTAQDAIAELGRIEQSAAATARNDEDARYAVFTRLVRVRERIAFANPLVRDIDQLLFIGREALPPEEYEYGTCLMDQFYGFHATQKNASRGDGLYVLKNPFSDKPELVNLLEGKTIKSKSPYWNGKPLVAPDRPQCLPHPGGFLGADVSWDGKEIVFAWTAGWPLVRDWREETCFHIMKCKADGSDLEMITWGDKNDLFPCWLPNGRLLFSSERRGGFGRCHYRHGPAFTLHTMFPDGSDITCISPHETNEFWPSVDNDGMVVYMRWDYMDRGWEQAHHPWIVYPDGRDSREIFGNEHTDVNYGPLFVESIRAIPNSRKYVATACGHHALIRGSLFIFDPSLPDDRKFGPVKRLTPDQLFPESEWMNWSSRHSGAYGTAWPLSEDYFLCVYDGDANAQYAESQSGDITGSLRTVDCRRRKYAVTLLDKWGNKVEVFRHDLISAMSPMPLRARKRPPVIPHGTLTGRPLNPDGTRPAPLAEIPKTAEVALVNVMDSRYTFPANTEIKQLRIWQILPKIMPLDGEPRLGATDQHPGRRCLGTVPVEADGSAFFKAPVDVPFYMQALDAEGCAVQTMRSVTYVHPGERLTCNGCHEPRERRAKRHNAMPLAFKREPSQIEPEVDGGLPWNYLRTVQPVLDRNCTRCHDPAKPDFNPKTMPVLVKGDIEKNPYHFATSFIDLVSFNAVQFYTKFYTGKDWWKKPIQLDDFYAPHSEPGQVGARASKLYQVLKKGHHGVTLEPTEMRRLILFMDSQGSYISHDHKALEQCRGEVVEPVLE